MKQETILKKKKGEIFHLDEVYGILQELQTPYTNINEDTGKPDDLSDTLRADKTFELKIILITA
jgi:hypothetical protein